MKKKGFYSSSEGLGNNYLTLQCNINCALRVFKGRHNLSNVFLKKSEENCDIKQSNLKT